MSVAFSLYKSNGTVQFVNCMMQMNDAWYLHQDNVTTYIAGYMVYKLEDEACVLLACSSGYLIMRTIKSMRGIYAENSQDGKYAELDRFVEAYRFRAPRIFAGVPLPGNNADVGQGAQASGGARGNRCDKVDELCQIGVEKVDLSSNWTADEYRLRALTVDPLQWQERSANWHMAERMAGHTEL